MAVYITPQSEIDKYFESENLNQSRLKSLEQGLSKFLDTEKLTDKELYYGENKSFIKGSAVDCLLTGEEGKFEDLYYISDIETKPSDTEMSIINMVFDDIGFTDKTIKDAEELGFYQESLIASIEFHDWYGGKPGEKRTAGLIERGTEYFADLKMSFGKQVLSKTEYLTITEIVKSLQENPRTAKYFDRIKNAKLKNVDFYYQLPIYFEFKGLACKALLDLVIVAKDDDGNILYVEPIDLKTMAGDTLKFISSLKSWRYDIQAAWYTEALESPSSTFRNIYDQDITGKIKLFKFIVESSTDQGQPLVYEITPEVLHIGKYGRTAINTVDLNVLFDSTEVYQPITLVKEIKGFYSLVNDYLYYQNQGWKEDKIIAKSDEVLKIGWEGVILNDEH